MLIHLHLRADSAPHFYIFILIRSEKKDKETHFLKIINLSENLKILNMKVLCNYFTYMKVVHQILRTIMKGHLNQCKVSLGTRN